MSSSNVREARLILEIYERRPYPVPHEGAIKAAPWLLPPTEWISAVCPDCRFGRTGSPRRILVAGCGTGAEAFALRERFHEAHITALDFSPRSIAIARDLQRRFSNAKRIRFEIADLSNRSVVNEIGAAFDFVSCHGVLSYIPRPAIVVANLARCMADDGALYVGVNGPQHFSVALRKVLPAFGVDLKKLNDNVQLRQLLRLCDLIGRERLSVHCAKFPAGRLAGDLFGPVLHSLSLSRWLRVFHRTELHFQASFHAQHELRRVLQKDVSRLLVPKSRAQACEIVDALRPASFHRLVFTRSRAINPPWKNEKQLLEWRAVKTALYRFRLPPKSSKSPHALQDVVLTSEPIRTRLEGRMPNWGIEILRQANGRFRLADIVSQTALPFALLRDQLYRFYQLNVINIIR